VKPLSASLFLIALLFGCSSPQPAQHGIPNYRLVDAKQRIARGGQPTPPGFAFLKSNGFDRVLKLSEMSEGSDAEGKKLGMLTLYFPMSWFRQVMAEPEDEWMHMVVGQIRAGTFVHCLHGEDRTGVVMACYRLSIGWTKEAAEEEMFANGFHKIEDALWRFWLRQRAEDWRPHAAV